MTRQQDIFDALQARRQALGMSYRVLARRANLTTRTVKGVLAERRRASLATALALAHALSADIGVLRAPSPSVVRRAQARKKARQLAALAQGSAALEKQAVPPEIVSRTERKLTAELVKGPNIGLWD